LKIFRVYNKQTKISLATRKTTFCWIWIATKTNQQFGFYELGSIFNSTNL